MRVLFIGGAVINAMAFLLLLFLGLREGFSGEYIAGMCANFCVIVGLAAVKQFKGY